MAGSRGVAALTHLMYPDDLILSCKGTLGNFGVIYKLFICMALFFGQWEIGRKLMFYLVAQPLIDEECG